MGSGIDVNLEPLSGIVGTGTKTSTTPGSPVHIVANSTICASVCIKPLLANVGSVKIGNTSTCLFELSGPLTLDIDNLYDIMIDVTSSGDGICWIALG